MKKFIKIQLKNFQKHSDLTVDLNKDLTVLTGETASGKTCVYRALELLCNCSSVSEVDYRKENTKETSVKAWTNDGFIIERIRSNSINRYILSKEGMEDQVFDKFGKDMPDEIKQAIGFDEIEVDGEKLTLNFANQDQMNFLIDSTYSDIFKAQLFNKLTGNELLDKVFKKLNKESLRINRELQENEEKVEKQKEELVEYSTKYKECKEKLTHVKESYHKIKEDVEIYNCLKDLADKLSINETTQKETKEKASKIKIISEDKIQQLKGEAERLQKLKDIQLNLNKIDKQIISLNNQKCKVVEIDFEKLKNKAKLIKDYNKLYSSIHEIVQKEKEADKEMRRITDLISANDKELQELWANQEVCPLCKKELH